MGINVCGYRLLVRPYKLEEVDDTFKRARQAGIEIPEASELSRERSGIDRGTVISIGSSAFKAFGEENWCKVGDKIAFAKWAGKNIIDPETNEKLLVINDEDVVAVFTGV